MTDEFLRLFNSELTYFAERAKDFAQMHPEIAGRLQISKDEAVADPHVERLIQAVAFLNARIRYKIQDDFPELAETLIETLYPHYLKPVPSMAIIQFTCQSDLEDSVILEPGIEIETSKPGRDIYRYRTCYPVELWPIGIEAASLSRAPFKAPPNPSVNQKNIIACLRLGLSCISPQVTLAQLAPVTLRFYLRGERHDVLPLYELIFNHPVSVALADSSDDANPLILQPKDAILPVGFEKKEGLLPYPARSFIGYRLLTEFFVFPEKFLFFDLVLPPEFVNKQFGRSMEIFIYLNRSDNQLERQVSAETFALGCAPVVNLFPQRAAPITLSEMQWEYPVEPDVRRSDTFEIYSIDKVYASSPKGVVKQLDPFYYATGRDGKDSNRSNWFWHATRRLDESTDDRDSFSLSFINEAFNPSVPADWTISVETTCTNHRQPRDVQPTVEMVEQPPTIRGLSCLKSPSRRTRLLERDHTHWRLMSHLLLNHLSLTGEAFANDDQQDHADNGDVAAKSSNALREILKLYDFEDSERTQAIIQSITAVRYKRGIARTPGSPAGTFCHGIDVEIDFDTERFSKNGFYLFSCILDRFIGLYCSINAFTRLTTRLKSGKEVWKKWPARSGNRLLL